VDISELRYSLFGIRYSKFDPDPDGDVDFDKARDKADGSA